MTFTPPARDTAKPRPVLTVSELTAQIRFLLESTFDSIAVVGEISNAKVYSSGHWYFSLKDQEATLPCVCFKNTKAAIKFQLEDGLMVVARGKLNVWPPRGGYQMVVTFLEPVGIGDWQLAFEQLREKLDKEGLLDPARKRPIPTLPGKVGVVTSLAGAALRDILSALRRRNRNVSVVISPAKVQGEGSPEEIARAIAALEELDDLDAIIVARGGGSIEDLWSFNTEIVARAVAASRVPVISGVGHETDVTICDLVADLRAPTPTAAAELVARGHAELMDRWSQLERRLLVSMEQRLIDSRRALERLSPYRSLLRYLERLRTLEARVGKLRELLIRSMATRLQESRHRLGRAHEKLAALGPLNVLGRGFAILRKENGHLVQTAADVRAGESLQALLRHGKLRLTVESVDTDEWYES